MLASQAAVALDNAQWSQGLEQKVEERTTELQTSNALLEQRANELAIINSIQEGIAAELDFQAIVDLVGDKLREVFQTGDIGIRWYDAKANLIHFLYQYEHGVRLHQPPQPPSPGGAQAARDAAAGRSRTRSRNSGREDSISCRAPTRALVGGACRSSAAIASLGSMVIENYERENAFGESEVRLLTTVAASMGVALENARLFDETQRLLKETEQRNAELAVINSIQEGMAAELDFQAIIDLVGDKLREVFKTGDMGIRWYDPKTNLASLPLRVRTRRAPGLPAKAAAARRHVLEDGGHPPAGGAPQPRRGRRARDSIRLPGTTKPVIGVRADHRERSRARPIRARRLRTRERVSASPRCACCAPSPRAWGSRWRTHGCSTRRSGC